MAELNIPKDVCMIGIGTTAPCYYRIMMVAMQLGCDWAGVNGFPGRMQWATGSVRGGSIMPDLIDDYKVVVLQQPSGESWRKAIEAMQERGKKVVFEVDDYLHGINKLEDHEYAHLYDARALVQLEECMRACDALIASTEYIAHKYKKFNPNVYVCRIGIDLKRYNLTRPKRNTVNIGWSGATGHINAMRPWLNVVIAVMQQKPEVAFVSIGMPFADAIKPHVGDDRTIMIRWCAIEQYPAAMSMFDIALAPGGGGAWHRGKSDLRWLEASALGIPIIARPSIYPEIEPGVTGFHATSPSEMAPHLMALIGDEELRLRVGAAAKEYVTEHRTIEKMAESWGDALRAIHAS